MQELLFQHLLLLSNMRWKKKKKTDLADEGKGLPPHPLGAVAKPDSELIDEVQAQIICSACIEFLQDLYNLEHAREQTL